MRLPDGSGLRIHRLPYLAYPVTAESLAYATDCALMVKKTLPNTRAARVRQVKDKVLACVAFADTYGVEDQFMATDAIEFMNARPYDFYVDEYTFHVIPSRINELNQNIGPTIQFRVQSRALRESEAEFFVAAAIALPAVNLLGWATREEMGSNIQGWSAILYAGSPSLKAMHTLPIEARRKKGFYV